MDGEPSSFAFKATKSKKLKVVKKIIHSKPKPDEILKQPSDNHLTNLIDKNEIYGEEINLDFELDFQEASQNKNARFQMSNYPEEEKQEQEDDFGQELEEIGLNFQLQKQRQNFCDDEFEDVKDQSSNDLNKQTIISNKQQSVIKLEEKRVQQLVIPDKHNPIVNDDDFDYDDNESGGTKPDQEIVKPLAQITTLSFPKKADFKKFLPSKQDMKKKNYIGDAIIAERAEQDEIEGAAAISQRNPSKPGGDNSREDNVLNPNEIQKPAYLQKFSKISQICEESTKEYKIQLKEMGIKKEEAAIVAKAKAEMLKIEEFKNKFLQSAFGGVFTNNLKTNLESITQKHSFALSQTLIKQTNEQVKIGEVIMNQKKNKTTEESKEVVFQVELNDDIPAHKSGNVKSAAKKKKKKARKNIQTSFQNQYDEEVGESLAQQNQEENDNIEEEEGNNSLQLLLKNNKNETQLLKVIAGPKENELGRQSSDGVDWDALNRKNQKDESQQHFAYIEDEKLQFQRENIISYANAQAFFYTNDNILKHSQSIQQQEVAKNAGFLSSIASCFQTKLSTTKLSQDRLVYLSIQGQKFSYEIPEHVQIIKTIYKLLIRDATRCPSIGNHWVDIGFQRSDPSTDIRGAGMAGLLQALYFFQTYPSATQLILQHSRHPKTEFPLLCQMFEFSLITLQLLRDLKLNKFVNQSKDLFQATNQIFSAIFLRFILQYIENNYSINKLQELRSVIEREARSKLEGIVKAYQDCDDEKMAKLVKQSYKEQKLKSEHRLRQLAQEQSQFEIKQTKYVNPREKAPQMSIQKARNYESQQNNEEYKQSEKAQQSHQRPKDEFSQI